MSEINRTQSEKFVTNPSLLMDSVQSYEIQSENVPSSVANGEFPEQSPDVTKIETVTENPDTEPLPQNTLPPIKSLPEKLPSEQSLKSASNFVNEPLKEITTLLRQLAKDFDAKLKYDASKQTLIDKLYNENQSYKEGILQKFQHAMILAVIEQIDDAAKTISHFENAEFSEENYRKLLKYYSDIAASFQDMLIERFDIHFYHSEPNTPFDPKKQRSLKTVVTNDQSKHKLVKQSLRPGCETEAGFVLRSEMVEVYVFVSQSPQT
ncbi:MAG: hypothetical protein LBJ67_06945 [Planctomycetaceae bacterium]|jgi:molecular chaperone GrpE (heat shock protein)|nr:hypothetical protein [Planctomycetaceae bacterium]